jgi:hypothetical protein
MFMENNTDALERPEGEELHPRERERLLALMDRVVVLSEARVMLEARKRRRASTGARS